MRHWQTARDLPDEPVSTDRRRLIEALGASALGAWLGGCAGPPVLPPRPLDLKVAPRVGETWQYHYTSIFQSVAPRTFEVRVLEVTQQGVKDQIAGGEERLFTSALQLVERPLSELLVYEFSPYLQAFGPPPAEAAVAWPAPNWGPPFAASARVRGSERVTVPSGSFDALRMEIVASRAPMGTLQYRIDPVLTFVTVWYAPGPKRAVLWEVTTRAGAGNVLVGDRYQLASYRAA
jgi:hypothetical protein